MLNNILIVDRFLWHCSTGLECMVELRAFENTTVHPSTTGLLKTWNFHPLIMINKTKLIPCEYWFFCIFNCTNVILFIWITKKNFFPSQCRGTELEGCADGIATHVHDQTTISIVPAVLHWRLGMLVGCMCRSQLIYLVESIWPYHLLHGSASSPTNTLRFACCTVAAYSPSRYGEVISRLLKIPNVIE